MVFDTETGEATMYEHTELVEIVHSESFREAYGGVSGGQAPRVRTFGPHRFLYALFRDAIVRIDPVAPERSMIRPHALRENPELEPRGKTQKKSLTGQQMLNLTLLMQYISPDCRRRDHSGKSIAPRLGSRSRLLSRQQPGLRESALFRRPGRRPSG